MTENKQENGSQRLEYGVDAQQQQQHLQNTADISTKNNFEEIEFIRDDARKIFIGGLKKETTQHDLFLHFGQFGEIKYINVKVNNTTGLGRGFAFIVFKTIEGLDNALACTNHVINDRVVQPKKAVPRQVKLFVGGLSPDLTDDDITDYFQRYAPLVAYEMPYDKVKKERKHFCFLTFDSIYAVIEILKSRKHVIKGIQVDVRKTKHFHNYNGINSSRSMSGMQWNFCGLSGRRGFPPQSGYAPVAHGYYYGGYYNNQIIGYSPGYNYIYSYQCYGARARTDYQYIRCEPSTPSGGNENQIVE